MPTIETLAPAVSASDSDEFMVSQSGITRKITRAQILSGVQASLIVPAGTLLGNSGTGLTSPAFITVGRNLSLNGSTLSAAAAPFAINNLPPGHVPSASDLVPISQSGTTFAISYGQLLSGLSGVPNINLSQGTVNPSGGGTPQTLGHLAANILPLSGGTLTGTLTLAKAPVAPSDAVNKAYVDQQTLQSLPLAGGSISGRLSLAMLPQQPFDAATKSYVDAVATTKVSTGGGSLSGGLFLNGDPVSALQASSKRYTDLKVCRTGDTLTGPLVLAGDPTTAPQAATKNYADKLFSSSLLKVGGTLSGPLILASDPTIPSQAVTKQYADQKLSRNGDTLAAPLILAGDPTAPAQAANKQYVDTRVSAAVALSGSSMTGALLLTADPVLSLQAATKQYVDLRLNRNGDTVGGTLGLSGDPINPLDAATKRYVDAGVATKISVTGATFTGPVALAGVPTASNQAATKQYVDGKVSRSGDTLSGLLVLATDPVLPPHAATKNYVDAQIQTALPKRGGSLNGSLFLTADPTVGLQAATKRYVDNELSTALALTGGSLTGMLSLAAAPTTAQHAATKLYVDGKIATALPLTGGTLSGTLTLANVPTKPMDAATKSYVDANPNAARVINIMLPPYNARIDGVTDDTAAFKAAYQAAASGGTIYVPSGTTVLQQPGTWGVALTKRVQWMVAATVLADGTPLAAAIPNGGGPSSFVLPGLVVGNTASGSTTSQGSSQPSDFAVNQSSYIVNHVGGANSTVLSNVRSDTIIYNSPGNYVWGGLDRLIWAGTQAPSSTAVVQHVGRYVQTLRQSAVLGANGQPLPQPQLWGACVEYRDTTGQPSSAANSSLTMEMDWFGNGLDDANSRTIQSLVIGQHNTAGPAVEVGTIIGVYLSGGSLGSTKTIIKAAVPFSNAVLDTTNAIQINNAPVIRMTAGQAISFESTNSNRLYYDNLMNVLRWSQGSISYPVGKGISTGQASSYSTSTSLPSYIAGNLILLTGSTNYSINLPRANTVAAGTGFTFSVTGTGAVNILTSGSDAIDSGPIILHQSDRYHIVSDGSSFWHEIFWINAVSPRSLAPSILPSYLVANLPTGMPAGAKAFASNGCKPLESTGVGTGVEVCFDGRHWISSCSGLTVTS